MLMICSLTGSKNRPRNSWYLAFMMTPSTLQLDRRESGESLIKPQPRRSKRSLSRKRKFSDWRRRSKKRNISNQNLMSSRDTPTILRSNIKRSSGSIPRSYRGKLRQRRRKRQSRCLLKPQRQSKVERDRSSQIKRVKQQTDPLKTLRLKKLSSPTRHYRKTFQEGGFAPTTFKTTVQTLTFE